MSIKYWIKATRPKTLSAGIMPVIIGSSLAFYDGKFNWLYFIITFVCSLLIQIITNFINEIYDFKKGADTEERLGPQRQVASGNISEKSMRIASIVLIIITFILGLILVTRGGLPVLLIGVVSLILAYGYTGGPYPLAYKGLGDIFVLIFFGLVAVVGTYYIQTLNINTVVILAGLAPGFLSMNILGVNNIRDVETDKKVNKLTLAVRIGEKNAKLLYIILNVLTYISIIIIYLITHKVWILLPFLTIFHAFNLSKKIMIFKGAGLNVILEGTGKLLLLFGLLMSLGFILSKAI